MLGCCVAITLFFRWAKWAVSSHRGLVLEFRPPDCRRASTDDVAFNCFVKIGGCTGSVLYWLLQTHHRVRKVKCLNVSLAWYHFACCSERLLSARLCWLTLHDTANHQTAPFLEYPTRLSVALSPYLASIFLNSFSSQYFVSVALIILPFSGYPARERLTPDILLLCTSSRLFQSCTSRCRWIRGVLVRAIRN